MDIIGLWKITATKQADSNGTWRAVEELTQTDVVPVHMARLFQTALLFNEDGTISTVLPLPDGMPKSAVKNAVDLGQLRLYDEEHSIESSKYRWKEEDGKFYFNPGTEAMISEDSQSWLEIKESPEGFELMANRYVKYPAKTDESSTIQS